MKPRKPLVRRTPLVARSVLSPGKPLRSGKPLISRTPIKPVSEKRQRQNKVRVLTERDLGREGCYGQCARCLTVTYVNGHERLPRSQGGDPARPDCLLCVLCNGWAADNIIPACWTGWRISPKYSHAPELNNGEAYDLAGNIVIFASTETVAAEVTA